MLKNYLHLSLLFGLLLSLSTFNPMLIKAQNPIPNPGFENWTGGEPDDWNTINQEVFGTTFTAVTRDQTSMHSGTSSVKLETITQSIFLIGPVTVPGMITLGEIIIDLVNFTGTVEGGIPVTGTPQKLRGWYRYLPQTGDSCIMGIGLSRWNGTSRDTIAYSYLSIGGQHNDWEEFSVPVVYEITAEPDSMNVVFFSSNLLNGEPVSGSKLWVDDLWIDYETVSVQMAGLSRDFYIQPSGEVVYVFTNAPMGGEIQVFNLSGSLVYQTRINAGMGQQKLSLPRLPSGLYIAQLTTSGGVRKAAKFIQR
ncbi:MAG: PCMD domain-containing protein [Lentimicrobium sp.]|jgi:hypothetical protein|nr:PCMD domain-containing protein [Lentimicrobium sp.]